MKEFENLASATEALRDLSAKGALTDEFKTCAGGDIQGAFCLTKLASAKHFIIEMAMNSAFEASGQHTPAGDIGRIISGAVASVLGIFEKAHLGTGHLMKAGLTVMGANAAHLFTARSKFYDELAKTDDDVRMLLEFHRAVLTCKAGMRFDQVNEENEFGMDIAEIRDARKDRKMVFVFHTTPYSTDYTAS